MIDTFFKVFLGAPLILIFICLSFFISSLRFKKRKGKFIIAKDDENLLSFQSDFGNFHFNFNKSLVSYSGGSINIQDIAGVRLDYEAKSTLASESLIRNTRDLNNVIHWYKIKLVLSNRTDIPIFIIGEFEPKDWFGGWLSHIQIKQYQKLGLADDIEKLYLEVIETLLRKFESNGQVISLI